MKYLNILLFWIVLPLSLMSQSIIGAWEAYHTSPDGQAQRSVVIFADGYQVLSTYDATTGEFIHTNGGTWVLKGNIMTEQVEFHTDDAERVGQKVSFEIALSDSTLSIVGDDLTLKRIDDGTPGQLQGAWLMSGRVRDGETQLRDTERPRKTMKILSGSRFQWIAYDTETKEFKGTGGGTYTTIDGRYTEHLEFFSRDDSRVGAELGFDYELIEGAWHHSGLSSKGSPIHEIWSERL